MGTRLILIRHAETTANQLQRWYGSLDTPLTARGEQQVAATAARIAALAAQMPIDILYTSPLPRARRTAEPIGAAIGHTPVVDDGLREFGIGDWEGRSYRDLIDNEDLWGRWAADPTFAPPNGESPDSFGRRVLATFAELVERHPGQTVAIVAHGGVIGCVQDAWLGDGSGDWVRWEPHNCGISILEWNSAWHAPLVNDTSHLPPSALASEKPVYAAKAA